MDNIPINLTLTTESVIAVLGIVVTVLIAVIGGVYAIVTNTKKYELTENYRKELLRWYTAVVGVMIRIIHYSERGEFDSSEFSRQKTDMLSQLSALAETGRFYFPNVIKKDGFGFQKPSAYQGYRHINLEFMLYFYHVASSYGDKDHIDLLWQLERNFTSVIFDMIEPRKRNRDYAKYLALTIPKGQAIEDYIYQNPHSIDLFSIW